MKKIDADQLKKFLIGREEHAEQVKSLCGQDDDFDYAFFSGVMFLVEWLVHDINKGFYDVSDNKPSDVKAQTDDASERCGNGFPPGVELCTNIQE